MRAPNRRVEAWLTYLRQCPAGYCGLCDGMIGPAVTLSNCCICSREVIMAKVAHDVPIAKAPVVPRVQVLQFAMELA